MSCVAIKIGQTLRLDFQLQDDDGTPIDITSASITSQVQDGNGAAVATLSFALVDAPLGQFSLSASTAGWPSGLLSCDVCYQQAGVTLFSQTFQILSSPSITPLPGGG